VNIVVESKNRDQCFWVKYWVKSATNLEQAAREIAIGQTVGNPNARSNWETDWLFDNYCGKILYNSNFDQQEGFVEIGYPYELMDWEGDGISQLLCIIMGGQMDIDNIQACHAISIDIKASVINKHFKGPKYGIPGIRQFVGAWDQPLFGGIVKPKNGITPHQLLDIVKEMVEGGVHFIKEDEILSNPAICSLQERVPLISKYLADKPVVYCFCINGDHDHVLKRAKFVAENGGRGVHINVWSGLGVYRAIRNLDLPLFVHYQKSGDRTFTNPNHAYHISWNLLCDLAGMCGVDFIHAGMWGGYLNVSDSDLRETLDTLRRRQVMPALSCGMHAGLVEPIVERFGMDWMANVGGSIHSDPGGTRVGCEKMRAAVDRMRQ
jgi:ribulose-bisphosphate carboxylase large chain